MSAITEEKVCHENGKTSYRVKIQQFREKMRTWAPGRPVILKPFIAMDCVFTLKVFPSGFGPAHKGHVSLCLENQTKEEVNVKGSIQLGETIANFDQTLQFKESVSYSRFIPLPAGVIGDDENDEDENLAITCHISEIWKGTECKSAYLINKETNNEVKLLKSTMTQLDSRQTKISKFVGQSAPLTKLMSVKIEDICKKLDCQDSITSDVAENVKSLKEVVVALVASIQVCVIGEKTNKSKENHLDQNKKEGISNVEASSLNIDDESGNHSSIGEKLIKNVSDIKNILVELEKNIKVPSNLNTGLFPFIAQGFSNIEKTVVDIDSKVENLDFNLKAEVMDTFKCLESSIDSKLSTIEAQFKEEVSKENQNQANSDTELVKLNPGTIKLDDFIMQISQRNNDQVKHIYETGFTQQESSLKEKFDNLGAEIKELKRVIENSALINENKVNNNIPKPGCLGCNKLFDVSSKIAQCNLGHLMCWECKERPENLRCPTCLQPITGRAYGMENFLSVLFK